MGSDRLTRRRLGTKTTKITKSTKNPSWLFFVTFVVFVAFVTQPSARLGASNESWPQFRGNPHMTGVASELPSLTRTVAWGAQ